MASKKPLALRQRIVIRTAVYTTFLVESIPLARPADRSALALPAERKLGRESLLGKANCAAAQATASSP